MKTLSIALALALSTPALASGIPTLPPDPFLQNFIIECGTEINRTQSVNPHNNELIADGFVGEGQKVVSHDWKGNPDGAVKYEVTGRILDEMLTGTKEVAVKFTCFTRDESERRISCQSEFSLKVPTVKGFNMFLLEISMPRESELHFIASTEKLATRWARPLTADGYPGLTYMDTQREVMCRYRAKP